MFRKKRIKCLSKISTLFLVVSLFFMGFAGSLANAQGTGLTPTATDPFASVSTSTPQTITRLDFAKEINSLFGFTKETTQSISDVPIEASYHKELAIAAQAGYLTLDANHNIHPDQNLTRVDAIYALDLLYGVSDSENNTSYGYTDISNLDPVAQDAINAFANNGLLDAITSNKLFEPNTDITNDQLQTLLSQLKNFKWKLTWNDEFNEPQVDSSKWIYDLGNGGDNSGWGNNEKEFYTDRPENVKTDNGNLVITAKEESYQNSSYTSARLKTKGLFSQKYGKFETRAKLPTGKGYWPAIWMLPEDNAYGAWAASGEIDIMENHGSDPATVAGTIHYGGVWPSNVYTGNSYTFPNNSSVAQWHTYGLEWEPGELRWYVDGKLFEKQNNWYSRGLNQPADYAYPAPFDQPYHMLLNLAVGGNFDGDPDSTTTFPQSMQVDYVRAYQLTQTPTTQPEKPQIPKDPIPDNAIKALPDGNLVHNSDFTETDPNYPGIDGVPNSSYWSLYQGAGGAGSVQVDSLNGTNFAKINVTTPGSQNYSVQLLHTVSLVKGHYYKLTFDAKSTKPRNIDVKLTGGADRGYVAYSNVLSAPLSDQLQSYSLSFQMTQDTDIASRIEFNAGTNENPVWAGNLRLVETDGLPIDENGSKKPLNGDGNHVYNGTFDEGNSNRMIYWNFNTQNSTDATASVDPATRQLNVNIANGGSSSNDITLVQKGMQLIHDQTYQLTFGAKAKAARDIQVSLISKDGSSEYFKKTIALGTSMDTQTFSFTMPNVDDNEGQLVFGFGGSSDDVTMDNVKLIMTSTYIDPSVRLFPLINGDFDMMLEPWQGIQTNGGASTVTDENGVAKVSITNVGDQSYSNMLMQDGLSMSNGVKYILEFDAHSSVARQMEFDLEDSSYNRYFDQTVQLTKDDQHYHFELTMSKDQVVALKFFLGKITGDTATDPHDVYVDNVRLEVKGASQMANMLKNGAFDTNADNWSSFFNQGDGVDGSVSQDQGELNVSLSTNGSQTWDAQLMQNDLTLEKGKSYRLTFDARSTVPRTIQAIIEHNGDGYTKYLTKNIDLTTAMNTYSTTFTMTDDTDAGAHLNFLLGNIDSSIAQQHNIYFDNVSLVEVKMPATAPPAGHALQNGTFDTNTDSWQLYTNDGSDAKVATVNGQLEVNFPDYDGWFRWSTQAFQDGLALQKGKTYELSFDANSTKPTDKDIAVELVNSSGGDHLATQTVTLSKDMQTFTFDFTPTADDSNAKLTFLLGGNNLDGSLFTKNSKIYLDNVTIKEKTSSDQSGNTGGTSDQGSTGGNTGGTGDQGNTGGNTGGTSDQGSTGGNTGGTGDQGNTGGNTGGTGDQGSTGGNTGGTGDQGSTGGNTGGTGDQGSTGGNTGGTSDQGGKTNVTQPIISNGHVTLDPNAFNDLKQNGTFTVNVNANSTFTLSLSADQVKKLKDKKGNLKIENSDVILLIPAENLINGDDSIKITKMNDISSAYSSGYDFTLTSGGQSYHHFSSPITLTFKVNQDHVQNPEQIKVYYYNEQTKQWELIGGHYQDGYVTATTMHFSTYTLFRQTSTTPKAIQTTSSNSGSQSQLPNTAADYYNLILLGSLLLILGGSATFFIRK